VVKTELGTARFHAHVVGQGLSRTVFEWGRRLDGSAAQSDDEARVDVSASGASLIQLANAFADAVPKTSEPVRQRLQGAVRAFSHYLSEDGDRGRNKLRGLSLSGELGAEIRAATVALGGNARLPFYPRHRTREEVYREPVTVATVPAWLTSAPDVDKVTLGAELFFDKRLSQNQKLSCASCHDPSRGLTAGGKRPKKVNGTSVPRDVPSLYNVAFEPMLFWDGRASTLADQAGIAILDDLAGDWQEIAGRLSADVAFAQRFRKVFPEGIDQRSVLSALQEFERTLISDETPFDRAVRGDATALDAELALGFDVYFGKARCSRCHRLPLTSGSLPPRFKRTPVNVIGVPVTPLAKKLDADLGRGGITKKDADRFAFKTPSLRNLALTAPYFHNGSFRTLAEVVDFYAKGSAQGLGIDIEIDPDAGPFELDAREKKALVAFLTRGLRDAVVAPESAQKR
jgi:cytochrome c peroxidase